MDHGRSRGSSSRSTSGTTSRRRKGSIEVRRISDGGRWSPRRTTTTNTAPKYHQRQLARPRPPPLGEKAWQQQQQQQQPEATGTTSTFTNQQRQTRSSSGGRKPRRSAHPPRQFALLSLLSVVLVSQSAGAGIALEIIIVVFSLHPPATDARDPTLHALDMPSRVVLFGASCLSMVYVLLHLLAARRTQRLRCMRIHQQQQKRQQQRLQPRQQQQQSLQQRESQGQAQPSQWPTQSLESDLDSWVLLSASALRHEAVGEVEDGEASLFPQPAVVAGKETGQAASITLGLAGRGETRIAPDDDDNDNDKVGGEPSQRPNRVLVVTFAVLLARVSGLVWIATLVLTSLVAARTGLHVERGVQGNVPWLGLLVSAASLLAFLLVLFVIHVSDRPFVTAAISRTPVRSAPENAMTFQTVTRKLRQPESAAPAEQQPAQQGLPEKDHRRHCTLTKKKPSDLPPPQGKASEYLDLSLEAPSFSLNTFALFTKQLEDAGSSQPASRTLLRASIDSAVGPPKSSKHSTTLFSSSRPARTCIQSVPRPLTSIFHAQPSPPPSSGCGNGSGLGSQRTSNSAGYDSGGIMDGGFAWRPPARRAMTQANKRPLLVRDLVLSRDSSFASFSQINALMDHISQVEQQQQQQQQVQKWERVVAASEAAGVGRGMLGVEPTVPQIAMEAQDETEDEYKRTNSASVPRRSSSVMPRDSVVSGQFWTVNSSGAPAMMELQDNMVEVLAPNAEPREMGSWEYDGRSWAGRSQVRGASPHRHVPGGGEGEREYSLERGRTAPPNSVISISRPRTAAAALMQAKIGRRLQAVREQGESASPSDAENGEAAADTTTPTLLVADEPPRPRTAAAALMQEKVGKRIRAAKEQMGS